MLKELLLQILCYLRLGHPYLYTCQCYRSTLLKSPDSSLGAYTPQWLPRDSKSNKYTSPCLGNFAITLFRRADVASTPCRKSNSRARSDFSCYICYTFFHAADWLNAHSYCQTIFLNKECSMLQWAPCTEQPPYSWPQTVVSPGKILKESDEERQKF